MTMTNQTALLPPRPKSTVRKRVGLVWVALTSLAIVALSVGTYTSATMKALAENDEGLAPHYATMPPVIQTLLYIHIAGAAIALLLGPAQFATALRTRFRGVHRAIGRIYLVGVLVGGVAALAVAPFNSAGFVGFFGFATLAVLWIITAVRAYRSARARDFRAHQAWMIRNFALTYAAVTLRLWTGVLVAVHIGIGADEATAFVNAYAAVPFLAWLPNIVIAEIMIARRGLPGLRWTTTPQTPVG